MLMASILASMVVGGALMTFTGDGGEDIDMSDEDDLYDDDDDVLGAGMPGGVDEEPYGDILNSFLDDDTLYGSEADEPFAAAEDDDYLPDEYTAEAGDSPETPLTEDGTETVIDNFEPGQDKIELVYDAEDGPPNVELFGDPSGDALVYVDGHLTIKVVGGDGAVIADDVVLTPDSAAA